MTSPFDIRIDAPGALRTESMGITLKFDRTGPTTGRVSWNIPRPATGCTAENQAYCGIIITADTTRNTSTKLPTNGTVYNSDATVDANLFAGDTIGSSKVVGAFYHDRTTTFLDIEGLRENTPCYVSAFPVDCEFRYYQPGVHAYSLDYSQDGSEPTSGQQVVVLNMQNEARPSDVTGLDAGETYTFGLQQGLIPKPRTPVGPQECVPNPYRHTITIDGADASTYQDLLNAINVQLATLNNPPRGATPPNTNTYYWNTVDQKAYLWNGTVHEEVTVISSATNPSIVSAGTYWLHEDTNVLQQWDGSQWIVPTVLTVPFDPANPECDDSYWFDGTRGFVWTGNAWLPRTTVIQTTDPSLYQPAPCGSFWYNTTTYELSVWDDTHEMWVAANAIQYSTAPNTLPDGTYWFDTTVNKLFKLTLGVWEYQEMARISETAPTLALVADTQWYNPANSSLFIRNSTNTAWVETDLIVFETDPTEITYCSNWWNTTNDTLYVWDGVNGTWVVAQHLYEQSMDPTIPPSFEEGDFWYNPTSLTLYVWQNTCFKRVDYINWPTDPRMTLIDGVVWYNTTSMWFERQLSAWVPFTPTVSQLDPTIIPVGTMWFDTTSNALNVWNGIAWISVSYVTKPLTPTTGTQWFNTTTNQLMKWDGYGWVYGTPPITLEFNCYGNFVFTDTTKGSLSFVKIIDDNLFTSLTGDIRIMPAKGGMDGVSAEPLYEEQGIGTDGTNDERLKLHTEIRYAFGYPTVDVELTNEQLDFAIDRALSTYREHSSHAYKRGFFFLTINSNTQRYLLTNKANGLNKIVNVLGVHRLTSAFLSSAHGAGVYGQIVLQHLYNMGTFDLLSYHLMSEYTKTLEQLFAGRVTFTWDEQSRELWLHHRFPFAERMILVDAAAERTEQQLLSDRISRPWLRSWAIAEASMMLANVRGKYQTLPGASGGISLNASDLRAQATTDFERLMAEIADYVADTPENFGMHTQFTFG